MEEPDEDDGGVLQEGEPVVEHVFVTGAFLFGIEEHENVDDTCNVNLKNKSIFLKSGSLLPRTRAKRNSSH